MSDDKVFDGPAFLAWLVTTNGYRNPRLIGRGRYVAIYPKAYTHAIITGRVGDRTGYGDCWCYLSYREAAIALARWDGEGEPEGWIRHPHTGRRVSMDADERDDAGRPVGGVGVPYVRG